ncbi:hypothetical protein [Novosphingobium huizhouense]|uniref:hypothetical protein n=1 Tax=Novosphingobium huizhouense TaxID=2866625 RepID=UPI001CD8CFFE|nr:hypothetical protein [Novosphingobium huizhouense]
MLIGYLGPSLGSPIRGFTRLTTTACEVGATQLPAGTRALLLYASGNRDERRRDEHERFDITRYKVVARGRPDRRR